MDLITQGARARFVKRNKGGILLKKITSVVTLILLFGGVFWYFNYYQGVLGYSTERNIEYIRDHMNSQGKLIDYQDEISVKSINDIKFFIDDKKVTIEFGKIVLEWKNQEFFTKPVLDSIKPLGFEVKRDKDSKEILLFWQGKEVDRWVQ